MAAGSWTPTNTTKQKMLNGTFDFDSDTFKMALFLSTSNLGPTSTTFAGVTNEVGTVNTGYTAGGESISLSVTVVDTDDAMIDVDTDPVWTAGSAGLTARFACIYEVSGDVAFFCLLDSTPADVSVSEGNTLTVATHTNGVARIT